MYICQECGHGSSTWMGKCPNCDQWNTLQEVPETSGSGKAKQSFSLTPLSSVSRAKLTRIPSALYELNRVLGGGFVPGEAVLLTGEPGIGKSTILLQGLQNLRTLYISGEEAAEQIRGRAERLGISLDSFTFSNTVQIESIIDGVIEHQDAFDVIVIDSIQTLHSQQSDSQPGSTSLLRELTHGLVQLAKKTEKPMIIVGHVTKGGDIAGPKTLEHIVDAVFLFEGERVSQYRILRAQKNRFGSTDEIGIFEMQQSGLQEISDSVSFIEEHAQIPGRAVAGIIEGKRPLFFEIQTLVVETSLPMPRRIVKGIDSNRLLLLLAVLRKHLSLRLDSFDVYVNVVGGLDIRSPAADLGIIASLISSLKNKAFSSGTLFVGEVGLLGEIRPVPSQAKIIQEAKRLQFTNTLPTKQMKSIQQLKKAILAE